MTTNTTLDTWNQIFHASPADQPQLLQHLFESLEIWTEDDKSTGLNGLVERTGALSPMEHRAVLEIHAWLNMVPDDANHKRNSFQAVLDERSGSVAWHRVGQRLLYELLPNPLTGPILVPLAA